MVRVGARQAILAECERWSSAIHRTGYIPHDMLEPCRPALVFVQNARQGSPLARGNFKFYDSGLGSPDKARPHSNTCRDPEFLRQAE